MSNYLLTGARAPVTLELARNLNKFGHNVFSLDTLNYPLARNSHAVKKHFQVPAPRYNFEAFSKAVLQIITDESIDYLIPTCEEAIYVSCLKDRIENSCKVFCPDFSLLEAVHSKYKITKMALDCGISIPETRLVSMSQLHQIMDFKNLVIKSEYSRFGTDVLIEPVKNQIEKLIKRRGEGNYILQKKLSGQEYCTYSIAVNGKLHLHVSYEPVYRVKKAAGIYFKQVVDKKITAFVHHFVAKHNYTGQLGFDFIHQGNEVYILECNPRATSGLHLLSEYELATVMKGEGAVIDPEMTQPRMVSLAVAVLSIPTALKNFTLKQFWKDFRRARDVIYEKNDKRFFFYAWLSIYELIAIAIKERISIRAASTRDVEWDGEVFK